VGIDDAGLAAAALAVALGLVELSKRALAKRNGGNDPGVDIKALTDVAREQLGVMREVERGVASIRSDLRAAALEQGHLQKSVDAMHRRFDSTHDRLNGLIESVRND